MPQRRAFLTGNPLKPEILEVFEELAAWIPERAELAGADLDPSVDHIAQARPDRLIVLGGDGTLLRIGGALGMQQLPLIGVNLGKLGYLAEFTVDAFKASFDRMMNDDTLISRRMMLSIRLDRGADAPAVDRAVNDFVIRDGPPFRMIELALFVDGESLTEMAGDGLIIATPTGSTAQNMSAGGPILLPGTTGIVITPICPHALTYRPLVVPADAKIEVVVRRVNHGTVVAVDGQRNIPLKSGQRLVIHRSQHEFLLVRNPLSPPWNTLITKLKWGASPTKD